MTEGSTPIDTEGGETLGLSETHVPAAELRLPCLTILCHPDVDRVGERAVVPVTSEPVELSRNMPRFIASDSRQRPLAVPHLSRKPLRLGPGRSAGSVQIDRRKTTTPVQVDGRELRDLLEIPSAALDEGAVLLLAQRVVLLLHYLESVAHDPPGFGLVGESSAMVRVREEITRVAEVDVSVLIRGASGTGKELVAAAIHRASKRAQGPFVALNMGAIPSALAASELFGAARGAFTGADRERAGYFARAHRGTLFLDEIGETPADVQPLLLRVLETGVIEPLGSGKSQQVDVRVVAATDAHLEGAVEEGSFRAPLLYRLGGYELELPSLRQRREDIGLLMLHFLRQELGADTDHLWVSKGPSKPWLSASVVARLAMADWPGNVRQLLNVVRQLVIHSRNAERLTLTPRIESMLAQQRVSPFSETRPQDIPFAEETEDVMIPGYRAPNDVGEDELMEALEDHQFKIQPTAAALRVSRTSLYELIDRSPNLQRASQLSRRDIEVCAALYDGHSDDMARHLKVSRKALRRRMTALGIVPKS